MKRFIVLFFAVILLTGCGVPYKSTVFRQIREASIYNQSVNVLGSALWNGKELSEFEKSKIKEALDEQVLQHRVTLYALEQYQYYQGFMGYESLETELNKLFNKTQQVNDLIKKYLGGK